MKILVIHQSGETEVINMVPPLSANQENESGYFGLKCGDGTTHFFNADGTYDGWSRKLDSPINGTIEENMNRIIQKVEDINSQREFPSI